MDWVINRISYFHEKHLAHRIQQPNPEIMSSVVHRVGRVEFAGAVKKIKTHFQIRQVQVDDLPRT